MNNELQIIKTYEDLKELIIKISHETPNDMELGKKIRKISDFLKIDKSLDSDEHNKITI